MPKLSREKPWETEENSINIFSKFMHNDGHNKSYEFRIKSVETMQTLVRYETTTGNGSLLKCVVSTRLLLRLH